MKFLNWVLGEEKPKTKCVKDCATLGALAASIEAQKVQTTLCLELVREMRSEMVSHHELLLRVLDMDKTPPFGRPRGVEMPQL